MIVLRKCNKCLIIKDISDFHKDNTHRKTYYKGTCKKCRAAYDKIRKKIYLKNPEVLARIKKYFLDNREILNKKKRELYHSRYKKLKKFIKYCEFCKIKINPCWYNTKWCINCRKKGKFEYGKKYLNLNREKIYKNHLKLHHKYMKLNPLYVLRRRCRSRLWDFLANKNKNTPEYLGCSLKELKVYLENQFKDGMNWKNMGNWHIDHKIPLCSAKTEKRILELCHYSNLQPLWKSENCKKSALDKKISKIPI